MSQLPEVFFHLGMAKAASTYLQKEIFPFLDGITFLKKHDFWQFREPKKLDPNKRYLFSWEFHEYFDEFIKEISSIYPHARFIYIFRKHEDWIDSKYKYYLKKGGTYSLDSFMENEKDIYKFDKRMLDYSNLVDLIHTHTIHKPLLLNYEDIKNNLPAVIKKIGNYTQSETSQISFSDQFINKSLTNNQLYNLRRINRKLSIHSASSNPKIINLVSLLLIKCCSKKKSTRPLFNVSLLNERKESFSNDWDKVQQYLD